MKLSHSIFQLFTALAVCGISTSAFSVSCTNINTPASGVRTTASWNPRSPRSICSNNYAAHRRTEIATCQLSMATNANNGEKRNESREDQPNSESESEDNVTTEWESLFIRIARMRLEEEHTQRFIKSRPAKLPYKECKKWVQAQNMWHSKEDWYEWVEQCESLSAYIPSDPEAYFSHSGTWISWYDFLGC